MKFKIWTIIQQIKHEMRPLLNMFSFLKRKTPFYIKLFFNSLQILILIQILLRAIFYFAPHDADIDLFISDLESDIKFTSATSVEILDYENLGYILDTPSNFTIGLNESYKVFFDTEELTNVDAISVTKSKTNAVTFNTPLSPYLMCSGDLNIQYYADRVWEISPLNRILLNTDYIVFDLSKAEKVTLKTYTGRHVFYRDIDPGLVHIENLGSGSIVISDNSYARRGNLSLNPINYSSNYSLSLEKVAGIDGNFHGLLNVYYTLTPTDYRTKALHFNAISPRAQGFSTLINVTSDGPNELYAYGNATYLSLASISLLPSFDNWYREHVYVIPLTLITTIIGGLTLTNTKKNHKSSHN